MLIFKSWWGDHTIELKSEGFPTNLQVMIVPQTVSVKITQKYTETFELGYDFINEDKWIVNIQYQ